MATSKSTLAGNRAAERLTLAQLLELHPFPAPWANEKRIERLWTFEVPCTPEAIWPHIADTSRMNRALGTAEMTFVERDGKRYGTLEARRRPARVVRGAVELGREPVADVHARLRARLHEGRCSRSSASSRSTTGTRLYLYFGAIPRGAFGATAMRLGFPTLERAYRRVIPALGAQLERSGPPC